MLKRVITSLLIIVGLLVVLGAIFVLYGREASWEAIFGPPDMGPVQFASLKKTARPNQALLCPVEFCKAETPDLVPPVYAVPVTELQAAFRAVIEKESLVQRVHDDAVTHTERYVIRTDLMRFPDTVRVQFLELSPTTSSLAIYAQAQIGYSDRGVNKARLQRWLAALKTLPMS